MFDSNSPFPQAISAFADCSEAAAANFQVAGAIHRLPCRNFPRGRRNPPIAVPRFSKKPERSTDCRAMIFQEAGAIPDCHAKNFQVAGAIHQLPCRDFPRGRRNPPIAVP
jgi:hypothetical protein